jgi:hypothetical protein
MNALLRLYPATWRERYQDEVEQLLEDGGVGLRGALDLIGGAWQARRHPERLGLPVERRRRSVRREDVGAFAAMVGGLMWLGTYAALWIAAMRMSQNPDLGSIALLSAAGPLLLIAVVALQPRPIDRGRDRLLAVLGPALVAVGATLMSVLLWYTGASAEVRLTPYELEPILFAGTALVLGGSVVAVAGMWGRRVASHRALALLSGACFLDLAFLAAFADVGFIYEVRSFAGAAAGMLVALGWTAVGWSALHRTEPASRASGAGDAHSEAAETLASQDRVELPGHLALAPIEEMPIRIARQYDRAVAQLLLDVLEVHAPAQQVGRGRMPEIVEPDAREASPPERLVEGP